MKNFKILISRIADAAKVLILGSMVAMTCSCEDFLTISPTDKIILEDFWIKISRIFVKITVSKKIKKFLKKGLTNRNLFGIMYKSSRDEC